jgi:hypothetical protein
MIQTEHRSSWGLARAASITGTAPKRQAINQRGFSLVRLLVVIVTIGALAAPLFWALSRPPKADPKAPRFVPGQIQLAGPFGRMMYDCSAAAPFVNDKLWFWTALWGTNIHHYLFNLKTREVEGELLNAGPVFVNQSGAKLLCEGHGAPGDSLRAKLGDFLRRTSGGQFGPRWLPQRETFWILDSKDNSSVRLGGLSQIAGSGSRFTPSPDFRFAYNIPSTAWQDEVFFLCDVESNLFSRIKPPGGILGELHGWWDDHDIFLEDPAHNFVLFDVLDRRTRVLFSAQSVSRFLEQNGLTNTLAELTSFFNWNGRQYDIYLTTGPNSGVGQSFLIKAGRAGPSLSLLYRNFQFHWLGHLDATATHYLYDGEAGKPGTGGNGGVFLRNLTNDTTLTLVPPDNSGAYALSRFYRDGVIYFHKRQIWRVDLDGGHNEPLFPAMSSPSGSGIINPQ